MGTGFLDCRTCCSYCALVASQLVLRCSAMAVKLMWLALQSATTRRVRSRVYWKILCSDRSCTAIQVDVAHSLLLSLSDASIATLRVTASNPRTRCAAKHALLLPGASVQTAHSLSCVCTTVCAGTLPCGGSSPPPNTSTARSVALPTRQHSASTGTAQHRPAEQKPRAHSKPRLLHCTKRGAATATAT